MTLHIRAWAAAAVLCAVSAAASAASYTSILTGQQAAPPNHSPAIGAAVIEFDAGSHALHISTAFSNLSGNASGVNIQWAASGDTLASLTGFPAGVRTGAYNHSVDTSLAASWQPAFLSASGGTAAAAEAAFLAGLNSGGAFLNLSSAAFPAGELRGTLNAVAAVPEPASFALMGLGVPAVLLLARRRRQR